MRRMSRQDPHQPDIKTMPWGPERLAARRGYLQRRDLLREATRAFFRARGYCEVETPYAVTAPGEEVFLSAFATERVATDGSRTKLWLHTSPEFAMKKLLAGGAGPIFQLARVWRNGEGSDTHAAEFTMLEWYSTEADMDALMDEAIGLLRAVLPPEVTCRGVTTRLDHVERISIAEAFSRYLGVDVLASIGDAAQLAADAQVTLRAGEAWDDLFFRLMLGSIEPHLGRAHPSLITDWPTPLAALAQRHPHDGRVAQRFELYVCGIELANGFVELTDANEQRARFIADRARRHQMNGHDDWPLDEEFVKAVAHLPPCAGIAMGFDRLAMIASDAPRITDVLWL